MSTPSRESIRSMLAQRAPLPIPDVVPAGKRVETAVLVPLVVSPRPSVTMLVRAAGLRHHAGEVCFPGGKREEGDASLAATALREAHEEIGLPADTVDILGALSPVPVATSHFRIHPFVGWISSQPVWCKSGEVHRVLDIPFEALASGQVVHQAVEVVWAGRTILSPFFVFEDETRLYGASAFVLVELMSVVGAAFGLELPPARVLKR